MTNLFMKVNKDLFNLGLNPTEILILAQVIEFNTNTGDCFISDKVLADNFGVSESTIKREVKKLEELGFIVRETRNVKGGRERHIKVNLSKIEEKLTSIKLSLDDTNKVQNELCTSVNLPLVKGQNDTIKDNIKDNLKDNYQEALTANAVKTSIEGPGEKENKPDGSVKNPYQVDKEWLIERHNQIIVLANGIYQYGTRFYKIKEN